MKRILILTAILLFVFAGCSSRRVETPVRSTVRSVEKTTVVNTPVTPPPVENTAPEIQSYASYADVPILKSPEKESILGYYETEFDAKDTNRGTNIDLAVNSINGKMIMPGEEFSYNDTIGSTTKERGYKISVVYKNGKKSKNYGGGVCQVSTTLCNAAIEAGMEITERHDHSLPVNYVKGGKEAATSNSGNLDLRFVNTKNHPVIIHAQSTNGVISISIDAA